MDRKGKVKFMARKHPIDFDNLEKGDSISPKEEAIPTTAQTP